MSKKSLSVCMATYNGEKYILQQLKSILKSNKISEIYYIVLINCKQKMKDF